MIYITGDTHGRFERIENFCQMNSTSKDDIMIILGDAGINFSGPMYDSVKKKLLEELPITIFSIHGNHEQRPYTIDGYEEKQWHGGTVYVEEEYPSLLFAKDGEIFDLDGKKTIVMGGAYSIDKAIRIAYGWGWWEDEQPSEEIKAYVEEQLDKAAGLGELLYRVSDVDEEADAYVTKQLSYQYPYQIETNRKVKYSVSELKHRAMEAVFEEEELNSVPLKKTESLEFTPYIPRFAGGEDTTVNQGALRGSAMHRALECLDVKTLAGSDDLEQQLEKEIIKITEKGRLTEEMRQLLRRKKLVQFYQSPLAMRMKAAAEREELFTERPFVMGQSADEIEHDGSDTMVLVQGIIDAFFIEDDEIVLLDYKTDVINSAEELKNRYQKQLDLYQCALEANLGKKVKEKLLYSFYLDAVVEV